MVFDDDPVVCAFLSKVLRRRGYEVTSYQDAACSPCPLAKTETCAQPADKPCARIILSDIEMPRVNGLDFVEDQFKKSCKCNHVALISGHWSEENIRRAKQLPVRIMEKPVSADQINAWLDEVEEAV
jgi:CheY-like chemotaxis protein